MDVLRKISQIAKFLNDAHHHASALTSGRGATPEWSPSLDGWYRVMKRGSFASSGELRKTFGSVDKVGRLFVFNVGGNKIRLIAAIHSNTGKVFIRAVLSHADYDAGAWKE